MKKRQKKRYVCSECGAVLPTWTGRCPRCGAWHSIQEDNSTSDNIALRDVNLPEPVSIEGFKTIEEERILLPDRELNRLLGGGIVRGSLILMGGEPGIGKSTLWIQQSQLLQGKRVLYIAGEENEQQVKSRMVRIGPLKSELYLTEETQVPTIETMIRQLRPDLVVIDSIQTLTHPDIDGLPGTPSQIRQAAQSLQNIAKELNIPIVIIGHITKEGVLAGPKELEHVVDVVLYFEGERSGIFRQLRSVKNRFGPAFETVIYEMTSSGLKPVDPSVFLDDHSRHTSGVARAIAIEGTRPMWIEVQALVSTSYFGTPQRSIVGYDPRRVQMLIAVIEKRMGIRVGSNDIFVNIAGGIKVQDPAVDLAVIVAIVSSFLNKPVEVKNFFVGEVGLTGEVRSVPLMDARLNAVSGKGITLWVPAPAKLKKAKNVNVVSIATLQELYDNLFS